MPVNADVLNAGLFSLAAIGLLGSPGPAIAALVAVGKEKGFSRGLRFYGGLQAGLAIAAAICAAGLFSAIRAQPGAMAAMTIAATFYLIYLAFKIATAPVGTQTEGHASGFAATASGGFLLGVMNPKAYVAFISLMASYPIVRSNPTLDLAIKWLVCVAVMIAVDIIWLWLGVVIRKANPTPKVESLLNAAMGGTILITALVAYV
ncbi:Threonine/homoserine/homoserine lactone efflux protein [Rhizobiales bacterium GAS191]|nr:Threonine/homoserine/homoserine lactone efflux protein [Rhizobiales bacterium GAS191]